jgi:hypothetical protein
VYGWSTELSDCRLYAQHMEVLGRLRHHVGIEFHHDPTDWGAADLHVKENLWVQHLKFESDVA